ALQRALTTSPVLAQARARLAEARYKVDEAYVPAYPTLDLTATYFRQYPSLTFPGGTTIVAADNYNVTTVVRQALYTFGRLRWGALAAELAERSAREDFRKEAEALLTRTSLAYLDLLVAQEDEAIQQDQVEARLAHLSDAEKLFAAGVVARFDVIKSQADVLQARQDLLVAANRRQLAEASLASLVGLPPGTSLVAEPVPEAPPPPQSPDEGLQRALERRPELTSLAWAVEAARARVRLAQAQDSPNLSLQSQYVRRNATGFSTEYQWVTSVILSVPLFDGGLSAARAGQAEAVVAQLQAGLEEQRRLVRLEVQSAWLDLRTNFERIAVAQKNLEQAEEALRVARVRYQAGVGSNLEQTDAETAWTRARLELATARFRHQAAYARWLQAVSGDYAVPIPPAGEGQAAAAGEGSPP
ncbi:MAG TPA: TolC family protein, partial [Candidatus Nitrosotenuis sp.]|nr:TolC family protein [Candidatus Nitrosotenuis sp.]